jgi:hypothetical protein
MKHGKMQYSGHLQCPNQYTKRPYGKKKGERHVYKAAQERIYLLEGFRDGIIDDSCHTLGEAAKNATNSDYDHRAATLYSQYMEALRKNKDLIHLGETM